MERILSGELVLSIHLGNWHNISVVTSRVAGVQLRYLRWLCIFFPKWAKFNELTRHKKLHQEFPLRIHLFNRQSLDDPTQHVVAAPTPWQVQLWLVDVDCEIEIVLQQVSTNRIDYCLTAINTLPSRTLRRTIGPGTLRPCTPIDTPINNVCRRSLDINSVINRSHCHSPPA
jgi:hypothetical protein